MDNALPVTIARLTKKDQESNGTKKGYRKRVKDPYFQLLLVLETMNLYRELSPPSLNLTSLQTEPYASMKPSSNAITIASSYVKPYHVGLADSAVYHHVTYAIGQVHISTMPERGSHICLYIRRNGGERLGVTIGYIGSLSLEVVADACAEAVARISQSY